MRIALIADVKDWAFDIAANIIKDSLSQEHEIDIFYSKSVEFNKDLFEILEKVKEYDLIHFFWRAILLDFEKDEFKQKVLSKYEDYEKYVNEIVPKISTGVYDHLYEDDSEFNKKFTRYCNKYVVSSKKLFDIYNNIKEIKMPTAILGDSFEKDRFYPMNMERFRFNSKSDTLIIGWVGNSAWNEKEKDINGNAIDFKGFHTILKPVIDRLKAEGYNVKLELADKNVKQIPNDKMCEYYSKIHIYVCVSNKEGTPKPLLEAMGCAIPVIATDVGIVNEVFGKSSKEYIVGTRIIGENEEEIRNNLYEKIKYLYNNREEIIKLSKENYIQSQKFEIQNMKKQYDNYFKLYN